jgi:hypothetical protein
MRIIIVCLVFVTIHCCSTHKKTVVKKTVNNISTEELIKLTPRQLTSECEVLTNHVKNNLKFEFDRVNCSKCFEKPDSAFRFIYFTWKIDSTIKVTNSKCWIGLSQKDIYNIMGSPYKNGFYLDNITSIYRYQICNSRRDADYSDFNWEFTIKNGIVTSSKLEKEERTPIDKQ